MSRLSVIVVSLGVLASAGLCRADGDGLPPPSSSSKKTPRVTVTVSVDWEGRSLDESNIRAFEKLREDHPDVPLTHFLSGAYFTKPGVDVSETTAAMRRMIRPIDETGHHVHVWRSLVEAAGVKFHTGPTFWGDNRPLGIGPAGDVGHELELTTFNADELQKIVHEGVKRLTDAGFTISKSFRAGGWIADKNVLEAIRREGFLVDSSATDGNWHEAVVGNTALPRRIREVWPGVKETTQPFVVETSAGKVLEMPDTGALADYVTEDQMVEHLRRAIERARAHPEEEVFAHIGFHQESAGSYVGKISRALDRLKGEGELVFVTLEEAASRARANLALGSDNAPALQGENVPGAKVASPDRPELDRGFARDSTGITHLLDARLVEDRDRVSER